MPWYEHTLQIYPGKIIDKQLELKQFMNSDITLKEITKVKKIFKRNLLNINHIRMEYPDIN